MAANEYLKKDDEVDSQTGLSILHSSTLTHSADKSGPSTQQTTHESHTLPSTSHSGPQNLTLNTNKAGMEGLDTVKINEIIQAASAGSRFYQHKQKRQQELDKKISQMKEAAKSFTEAQLKTATQQMDQLVEQLENGRDLSHTIVHVDMDMFYAAVEMRDNPVLRDKPMAVGGTGMLSTSNYAARKFGVRAAMPGFIGKKLCQELIIVPPNFAKYKQVSREIQAVFAEYDPGFSAMSLDEAYLDITDYLKKRAAAECHDEDDCSDFDTGSLAQEVVAEMRKKIELKTQLTASAGIAPNTRLAKVCSDMNKPNGQYYLPPDREKVIQFAAALPIRKVSGIGNVTEQHLQALDINICSDILAKRGLLKLLFSDTSYHNFINIALGLGHTSLGVWTEKDRKSISTETTFKGTADKAALFKISEDLCQELVDEMEQKDIMGKVFTLKIKTVSFEIRSRAQTLPEPTQSLQIITSAAKRLLQHEMNGASPQPLSLRLIGVRMSTLTSAASVGPNRQATLTQMFSRSSHAKMSDVKSSCTIQNKLIGASAMRESDRKNEPVDLRMLESGSGDVSSNIQVEERFVGPKSKKTSPMEHFLLASKEGLHCKRMKSYECSICAKDIFVRSLKEFNEHTDMCLESQPAGTSDIAKKLCHPGQEKTVSQEQIVVDVENASAVNSAAKVHQPASSSILNLQDQAQFAKTPVEDFLCPVCGKSSYKDINLLNKHVDECLSKSTISEMLQQTKSTISSSETNPQTSNANKRKTNFSVQDRKKLRRENNTLDKYFHS